MWPLSLIEILGVNKYHPLCLLLSRIEKKMCLKSDAVVSLLKNANIYLEKKGLKKENFYWIPNGYQPLECDVNHPLENDADYQKIIELRHAGFFIIGYTGAHGKPNHLEMLCQAVSQIENEKIQLFLIGEGNIKKELIRQYDRFTNIHFIESKPMSCMSKFQQIFNLAYWGFLPAKIYESGLGANKSYEYMHNQVPILTSSVLEDTVVNEASCGIFFDPCSIESLRQAILFAVSLPQNELREIGSRGKKIICDHYIYSNLAKKYLAIFLNMIDDKANLSK
ncbi:MAG: glycosyltransferase [Gammaproteobacteria bacterium]|nr:glycosyltransferase [Gammaproteobacteria bacterium]